MPVPVPVVQYARAGQCNMIFLLQSSYHLYALDKFQGGIQSHGCCAQAGSITTWSGILSGVSVVTLSRVIFHEHWQLSLQLMVSLHDNHIS
jgi:hypothetical protein